MQKISNALLVFNRRRVFSVFLTLFWVCNYSAQAQIKRLIDSNLGPNLQDNGNQSDWKLFPCTIQVSPYGGTTYSKLTSPLASDDDASIQQWSRIRGVSIDLGVLQIRRLIYKYFHTYPEVGLSFNYGSLENQGSLIGGQIYLKPQHDYQARWEIFPRIGVGISYATLPIPNFEKPATNERGDQATSSSTKSAQENYQKGRHWDLSFALVTRISIDPHWQLSPSIGFNYMPLMNKVQQEQQHLQGNIVPTSFTTSMTFGYTPNPGLIRYPSWTNNKHNRIDIGWLSTVKKPSPPIDPLIQKENMELKKSRDDESEQLEGNDQYYYVGGVYGQWSLHVYNNHAVTLATEWVLDRAAEQTVKNNLQTSPLKISLLGGHEFKWGKFILGQQLGFYITNSELLPFSLEYWDFYTRIGLNYKLTDFLTIGTNVKTNVLIKFKEKDFINLSTDFIDFRIGYSL